MGIMAEPSHAFPDTLRVGQHGGLGSYFTPLPKSAADRSFLNAKRGQPANQANVGSNANPWAYSTTTSGVTAG